MKNKIRNIIDILMCIFFIILMGYHITDNKIHEMLGVCTFVLFIIHNILNYKWYLATLKGKYNFQRILQTLINYLLLIDVIFIMASALMISETVFKFLNIYEFAQVGKKIHLVSTSWGFVLMSMHIGIRLNLILAKLNAKMKKSVFEYIYYLIIFLFWSGGLYCFIKEKMWKTMFLRVHFKFFNSEESIIMFYLRYIGILLFFAFTIYVVLIVWKNVSKKRNKKVK